MKAIIDTGEGVKGISLERNFVKPIIKENEILVEMKAVSISPLDVHLCQTNMIGATQPIVTGTSGAGIVIEKGNAVNDIEIGSRVCFYANITKHGAYAEFVPVEADTVSIIPNHFSFEQAACVPLGGYLAYHALYQKMVLNKKTTLFIQGIGGVIGPFIALLGKKLGLSIIASGHPEHFMFAHQMDVSYFIDYQKHGIKAILPFIDDHGLDIAILTQINFDKFNFQKLYDIMAFNGDLFSLLGFKNNLELPSRFKNLSIHDLSLLGAYVYKDIHYQKEFKMIGDNILQLLEPSDIDKMITHTTSFYAIPEIYAGMEFGLYRLGKIVANLE